MGFGMKGLWNVYGCRNKEHKAAVSFSIGYECDSTDNVKCPVCGSEDDVEYIDTDYLEREI